VTETEREVLEKVLAHIGKVADDYRERARISRDDYFSGCAAGFKVSKMLLRDVLKRLATDPKGELEAWAQDKDRSPSASA